MNPPLETAAMMQVGQPRPHESAHLHVRGEATYTDDIPEIAGTVHAAIGLSPLAHGRLLGIDVARLRAQGLRPIQIWVPDVRAPAFRAEAHRQSLAVATSAGEEDQAFIEAVPDLGCGRDE